MAAAHDRDRAAFEARASSYEAGWRGRMHHDIAARTAALARRVGGGATRILDVGCGTGLVARELAAQLPNAECVVGIDPAPAMVAAATAGPDTTGTRLRFEIGVAEHLPHDAGSFDLVVSVTSFDHWEDQGMGLAECARVLVPGGRLVLVDLVSMWLLPTMVLAQRDRARTRRRVETLLRSAGFREVRWRRLYATIIAAAVTER